MHNTIRMCLFFSNVNHPRKKVNVNMVSYENIHAYSYLFAKYTIKRFIACGGFNTMYQYIICFFSLSYSFALNKPIVLELEVGSANLLNFRNGSLSTREITITPSKQI